MFTFEFDEAKSQSNLEKHGIDFVQAQELWKRRGQDTHNSQYYRFSLIPVDAAEHWSNFGEKWTGV